MNGALLSVIICNTSEWNEWLAGLYLDNSVLFLYINADEIMRVMIWRLGIKLG